VAYEWYKCPIHIPVNKISCRRDEQLTEEHELELVWRAIFIAACFLLLMMMMILLELGLELHDQAVEECSQVEGR